MTFNPDNGIIAEVDLGGNFTDYPTYRELAAFDVTELFGNQAISLSWNGTRTMQGGRLSHSGKHPGLQGPEQNL